MKVPQKHSFLKIILNYLQCKVRTIQRDKSHDIEFISDPMWLR